MARYRLAFFISFNLELFLYFNISYQMISILFNFIEKKIMKYIFGLCYEEQPLEMRLQTMSLFCLLFHVIDIATFTTLIKCLFVYDMRL